MPSIAVVRMHSLGRTLRNDRNCGQASTSYSHVPLRRRTGIAKAEGVEKAVVTYEPKVKEVAPPPKETPIMHSSAYLVKGQSRTFDFMTDTPSDMEILDTEEDKQREEFSGNALEWALHKADEQLNQIETGSDGVSKAAMSVVKSPAGQVTLRTMQGFATVAAAAGPQLLKVAVPIGKQILKLGAQGLVGGVAALDAAKKQRDANKDSSKAN